jgi:hypothetical protein
MNHLKMVALVALVIFPALCSATSVDEAKSLFAKYVQLEAAFDPAAASLYSDTAIISSTRLYPDGRERKIQFPAPQYKALISQLMPLAKSRGDTNSYTEVEYTVEGENVRIEAVRYSILKDYKSPLVLVVGLEKSGELCILEEHTVTRP